MKARRYTPHHWNDDDAKRVAEACAERYGGRPRRSNGGWLTNCPAHEDNNPSLSVKADGGKLLYHCFAGCTQEAVGQRVWDMSGVDEFVDAISDGFGERDPKKVFGNPPEWAKARLPANEEPIDKRRRAAPPAGYEASYPYRRPDGTIYGGVFRYPPDGNGRKSFRQYGVEDGKFTLPAPERWQPYRIDELDTAKPVLIVEGEKCVHAAVDAGFTNAATWAAGTSKGNVGKTDWAALAEANAWIWPDADEPGLRAAATIARTLLGLGCKVRIVVPPEDAPAGWDIADLIDGHPDDPRKAVRDHIKRHGTDCAEEFAGRHAYPDDDYRRGDDAPEPTGEKGGYEHMARPVMVDHRMEQTDWLWTGGPIRGACTLLTASPKLGKSTVCATLAAVASKTGKTWPDGTANKDPIRVAILTLEGRPGADWMPRLKAAAYDPEFVDVYRIGEGDYPQPRDFGDWLLHHLGDRDYGMLIVDPIKVVSGNINDGDIARAFIAGIETFCERTRAAGILVHHDKKFGRALSQMTDRTMDKAAGSTQLSAAVRGGIWQMDRLADPDGGQPRIVFYSAGSNADGIKDAPSGFVVHHAERQIEPGIWGGWISEWERHDEAEADVIAAGRGDRTAKDSRNDILDALPPQDADKWMTYKQVAEEVDVSVKTARRHLRALLKADSVTCRETGGRGGELEYAKKADTGGGTQPSDIPF